LVRNTSRVGVLLQHKTRSVHRIEAAHPLRTEGFRTDRKVGARLKAIIFRDLGHVPSCKAARIPIVTTGNQTPSAVEISVEVQLFARVVLVDGLAAPLNVVHAVLHAIYRARDTPTELRRPHPSKTPSLAC
jgi:hypothetical protein